MSHNLEEKITDRTAKIGIIGLGYVGLPLACEFGYGGFTVTGIDIDEKRVNSLNEGKNYISDVDDEKFGKLVQTGALKATTDFSCIKELDVLSICVPTPLNKLKDPDVSFINHALSQICNFCTRDCSLFWRVPPIPVPQEKWFYPSFKRHTLKLAVNCFCVFHRNVWTREIKPTPSPIHPR